MIMFDSHSQQPCETFNVCLVFPYFTDEEKQDLTKLHSG